MSRSITAWTGASAPTQSLLEPLRWVRGRRWSLVLLFGAACAGAGEKEGGLPPAEEAAPPACEAELAAFESGVWRSVFATECAGCHSPGAPASGTRFVLPAEADRDRRYAAAARAAVLDHGDLPLMLAKPSGAHPDGHGGGVRLPVGSEGYERLAAFVASARSPACDPPQDETVCDGPSPGPRTLRRLTGGEFDRTISTSLGVDSDFGARFPADPVVHGFEGHAPSLLVTPALARHLVEATEAIAARIDLAELSDCSLSSGGCPARVVETLGFRLFRRPLSPEERSLWIEFSETQGNLLSDTEAGLRLAAQAMLQSPSFLYRPELGVEAEPGRYRLDPYEVASQLAFVLTGAGPDAALLEAAGAGLLDDRSGLLEQAERLARSPAGRAQQVRFFERWLDFGQVDVVPKDRATYPEFSAELRLSMRRETEQFVEAALERGAGLSELLLGTVSRLEPALAAFYAVSGEPGPDGLVEVDDPRRPGLLGQGSVLAAHARPNDASPVHRGRLVRERLLCQDLPPPPPGLATDPPPPRPGESSRERYESHSADPACRGCHRLIDPIGFGFSGFDGVGRIRDRDGAHPVDPSGAIFETPASDGSFANLPELAARLAGSPDVAACFVRQWLRFTTGLDDDPRLACLRRSLVDGFDPSAPVEALVIAIATSIHTTERIGEPTPGGEPPAPPEEPTEPREPPPPQTLDVERVTDSAWGTGSCDRVRVTAMGDSPVTWEVELELEGTLTSLWNAESDGDRGRVSFRGVPFNRRLDPGATAEFGFCLAR